jgi:hypothetical protein
MKVESDKAIIGGQFETASYVGEAVAGVVIAHRDYCHKWRLESNHYQLEIA